jgi:DNA-binding transcriptional MerR regulator
VDKSPDAFRTISEVAEHLDTPAHVLRFWESRFPQIRPVKRAGGRRYYRPSDVALLQGIKRLLHDEGLTIRGVQKLLRDQGVRHVAGLSDETVPLDVEPPAAVAAPAPAGLQEEVPEAGFIAVEDDEPAASPAPAMGRAVPVQPPLPLFETAPKPRVPREDVTVASLVRALPAGRLSAVRGEVQALAGRLAALRARLADRAEGGPS